MNIFGSELMARDNWNQVGGHAASAVNQTGQAERIGSAGQSVASLVSGQVFRGEILNITSKNVTIQLDNQQILQARLGESVELNIGQKLYFEVKENQGEQVFIRPMEGMNASGQSMAAEKALAANGFSFTEHNYQIADALLQAGMSLDKESMRKVMQQSMKYPDTSIQNLVTMNRLEIPVNDGNVAQFERYAAHEHQMTTSMDALLDGFEASLAEWGDGASLEDMQMMNQKLVNIFQWGGDSVEPQSAGTEAAAGSVAEPLGHAEESWNPSEQIATNPNDATDISANTAEQLEHMENQTDTAVSRAVSEASSGSSTDMQNELVDALRTQLSELGVPHEDVNQLLNQSKSYGEMISNLTDYFADMEQMPENLTENAVKNLFQSDSFRKLLRKGIQDEWLMKPEDMKKPGEIDELYQKILNQSRQLEQSLNMGESNSSGKNFSDQAQNMRDNIQFMQQLNQQFVFAQMPMNVHGEEANSELYVYANKKKLQQSTDGVKVLLHLDMPNLGSTDILVRLKDNMLHARFTLEDDTSVSVIADNMQDLEQKLTEKGFYFSNEVACVKPKTDAEGKPNTPDAVIDEMLNQDLITGAKRFTFDIRG